MPKNDTYLYVKKMESGSIAQVEFAPTGSKQYVDITLTVAGTRTTHRTPIESARRELAGYLKDGWTRLR